jgi:hypothetical protein
MRVTWLLPAFALVGCSTAPDSSPLEKGLPPLPPTGGPVVAAAGRLDDGNFAAERVPGPASQGLVGDYFMRNDKVRVVVQAPGRAIGPCPYGGNVIDFDRRDQPVGDQLGEVSPFLQLGRTLRFDRAEVVRDGSAGGPAVLRFFGVDVRNDYLNLPGLGGFAVALQDDYRADIELHWQGAVTYILMPGESRVRMLYTFYNSNDLETKTSWGTLSDTGAQIEAFHVGSGFGEAQLSELADGISAPAGAYGALLGRGIAYGIVPVGDVTAPFTVAGVDVEMYGVRELADALGAKGQTLVVPARATVTREVDVVIGSDIAAVTAAALAADGRTATAFGGTSEPGARVAVTDGSGGVVTVAVAGPDGAFAGALPDGDYTIQAEGAGWRRSPTQALALHGSPVSSLALPVAAAARLDYTIRDGSGAAIPGKVSVVGARPNAPDRRFRDVSIESPPWGIAGWAHSRLGDSARNDAWDHPIALAPGHYRVVVSRGPEWSRHEQLVDLTAAGLRVDAVLEHVAPTPGYVAADFHQHSNMSPDAPVPPADRLMGYIADGVDFFSSSDHDVHFDYGPLIDELGVRGIIDSAVGVETTPWDYGHFIGWPLAVDRQSPNGGAFDWGAGGDVYVPPDGIFAGLRAGGAQVVQVNHPRSTSTGFGNFQQNFDRAGLSFDFGARSFGGNPAVAPLTALALGLTGDAPLFSDRFDALEVYNGFHLVGGDHEIIDEVVDLNLRDWMNFLSFGFTPTAVGDSDSHQWFSVPPGLPRTLVRVPDDSPAALQAGIVDDVAATVSGRGARDVIVTNGPFLQLHVDGAGIGATVAHPSGPLDIVVDVVSAAWMPVDTVEIFANASFDVPLPRGDVAQPLVPVICFSSRDVPSARCQGAIGGARKMTAPVAANGKLAFTATAVDVSADDILARARPGARGRDLWLVARATGSEGMFPVIPQGLSPDIPMADIIAGELTLRGVTALAFTNPIYVDVDGSGWRAPFGP